MNIEDFVCALEENEIDFFTGVPDSLLSPLCNYLICRFGDDKKRHMVAHNEGGCVALAAGYHLATQKIPCIYMQNSGIGNAANPIVSLMHPDVYAIPALYIVGWRGEPGTKDEPQHVYQGEICREQLEQMGINTVVIGSDTTMEKLKMFLNDFSKYFKSGKSMALLVKKGALKPYSESVIYSNKFDLSREKTIGLIAKTAKNDIIVSTTGKISRELFEYRENEEQGHEKDFLTVGSMGHSSMIALSIALQKPNTNVWCIDGDGAALMHMGALGTISSNRPSNMIHIVLNNMAHESVGGSPTCSPNLNLSKVADAVGYDNVFHIEKESELVSFLSQTKLINGSIFAEICVSLYSRDDLGRPTTTPSENKNNFMHYMEDLK